MLFRSQWVDVPAPSMFDADAREDGEAQKRPSFGATLATVLLPVTLMMGKALADILVEDKTQPVRRVLDLLGEPIFALSIALVVAMFTLGKASGMDRATVSRVAGDSLAPVAGILLIVAAGGGFKQVLVDTGLGTLLAQWADDANISVLLLEIGRAHV